MSDLTDFLLARIAEDEAVAIATRDSHDPLDWEPGEWMDGPCDGPSGYQVVIVDPARVLAECEAKRRIVADFLYESKGRDTIPARTPVAGALRVVLLNLATVYADHPDYRPEWRP